MVSKDMQLEIPAVLFLENQEKFRRRIIILSRIIAILLILVIAWIGYIQFKYAKDINNYRNEYGPNWACYLCGLESGKSCFCNYYPDITEQNKNLINKTEWLKNIAKSNIQTCKNKNKDYKNLDNILKNN